MPTPTLEKILAGSNRRILWTGAGFSIAAGFPDMRRLVVDILKEVPPSWASGLTTSQLQSVKAAAYYATRSAGAGLADSANLEWVVSQLDLMRAVELDGFGLASIHPFNDSTMSGRTVAGIRSDLIDAMNSIFGRPVPPQQRPFYKRALEGVNPATVITTNYDSVARTAIADARLEIPVHALHGTAGTRGEIMPPSWLRGPSESLRRVWKLALDDIVPCDLLLIVGVSLPVSDQHLHHLLTLSTSNVLGPVKKRVVVINPDATALRRVAEAIGPLARDSVELLECTLEEFMP